jgi:rhomboid-like protein
MNSLWPAASRISCLNTRSSIFQTCHKIDSLTARLAHRSAFRQYSISSLPVRLKERRNLHQSSSGRICRNYSPGFWIERRAFATKRIITEYEELPKGYKDAQGLPFRGRPLSAEEVKAIFGGGVDVNTANRLLTVLHGRRVAGTLDDPNVRRNTSAYEERAIEVALAWLRENVPVDEIGCAGLRAEEELAKMQADIISDAERIGLYKPNSKQPNSREKKNVYGESGLDAIRKAKERELDEIEAAEKRQMSQADEIRQNTGTLQKISPRYKVELKRPGENPYLKKYLERGTVWPNKPPDMTKFQRLWPSGLLVFGVVAGCLIFAQVYTPPKNSSRMLPDMPPSATTIISIIVANAVILFAWRVPPLFRFLNKNFITMPGYPYPASLVGNIFSHQSVSHFAVNMVVLWFVGTRLHEEIGRGNFLAIYLACGALGSYASLTSWVLRNNFISSSLGASGALSGIIACYLWLNSSEKVTFFGVFPPENWPSLSAIGFLAILIGLDVFGLTRYNKMITVDHWAHLGGYATGIGAAELLKMRRRQRRAIEMERRKNMGVIDRIREGRL